MSKISFLINDTSGFGTTLVPSVANGSGNRAAYVAELQKYLEAVFQNPSGMAIKVSPTSIANATGTFTLSGVVATNTCQILATTFTCVNSGATGTQFNKGADDTATAVNLAAVINATAAVTGAISASPAGAVVTITANDVGASGNSWPITGGTNITASGSTLSGGVSPTYQLLSGVTFST